MSTTFTINGILVSKDTKQPLAGLRVEAWDKDLLLDDLIGSSISTDKGKFKISFTDSYFREIFADARPDIFFRVYDGNTKIADTRNHLLTNLNKRSINITLQVKHVPEPDQADGNNITTGYSVAGRILSNDILNYSEITIEAFDVDLRSMQLLGKVKPGAEGHYYIAYSREKFARNEKVSADLRLYVKAGNEVLLETPVIFNAPPVYAFDLTIGTAYKGVSEFANLSGAITPLLDTLSIAELTEDAEHRDITFLSGELNLDASKLEAFIVAHRLHELSSVVPPEFYFALLRNDVPSRLLLQVASASTKDTGSTFAYLNAPKTMRALLQVEPAAIEQLVRKSVAGNLIPVRYNSSIPNWVKAWSDFRAGQDATNQPDGVAFTELLSLAGLPRETAGIIASKFTAFEGFSMGFWNDLKKDKNINNEHINQAQAVYRLNEILDNNTHLAKSVINTKAVTSIDDVRELAKWDETDWKKINRGTRATNQLTGADPEKLAAKFEAAFPTSALVGRIRKDKKTFKEAPAVEFFHEKFPDKELHKVGINSLIKESLANGIVKVKEIKEIANDLLSVQRVFKLAPTYKASKVMLDKGLKSAQSVYNMGADNYSEVMEASGAMTNSEANAAYSKAEDTYAVTLAIMGDMNSIADADAMEAMPTTSLAEKFKAVADDFPNLHTLFQTIDSCSCEHCRSVYSPSAYLADQLRFLKHRKSVDAGIMVKDVLFNRRPDIGEIELSCANTNTPMPFIDLVCEILENAVKDNFAEIATVPLSNADGSISTDLLTSLLAIPLPVTAKARVTAAGFPVTSWIVRDEGQTYRLDPAGSKLRVRVLKQTHLKDTELKAYPEYINDEAYKELKKSKRVPILPFDLNWMSTREYLAAIDVDRYTLMDLFHKAQPDALALTEEYFEFSKVEADLIITEDLANQANYWGDLTNLNHVDVFLNKSRLEYADLKQLLSLSFTNPAPLSVITIPADSACDTSKQSISNFNSTKQDRIHRFLRLWRKLGWNMTDLDKVLINPKIAGGTLNDAGFKNLGLFAKLTERLHLSPEEALLFFGGYNLNRKNGIYQRLFLNKTAFNPLNPNFLTENIKSNVGQGATITEKDLGVITAALSISGDDLKLLTERVKLVNASPDVKLNLTNLVFIHRHVILAKSLNLSIAEVLAFIDILDVDILNIQNLNSPFENLITADSFITFVQAAKRSALSAREVAYLLMNRDDAQLYIPADTKILAYLTDIRTALQQMELGITDATITNDEWLKSKPVELKLLTQQNTDKVVSIFQKSVAVAADSTELSAILTALLTVPQLASVNTAALDATKKPEDRFLLLRGILSPILIDKGIDDIVTDLTASAFGSTKPMVDLLLTRLEIPATSPVRALYHNVILRQSTPALTEANVGDLYKAYRLLAKVSLLIQRLKLDLPAVELVFAHATDFSILNFNQLQVINGSGGTKAEPFRLLLLFSELNRAYPGNAENTFVGTLNKVLSGTEAGFLTSLADVTSWPLDMLKSVKTWFGYTLAVAFRDLNIYSKISQCIAMLNKLRANTDEVAKLIVADTTQDTARLALNLAKAHFDENAWLETSGKVQSVLRQAKRNALVAWLIEERGATEGWNSPNDLYSYYLIDVEMEACEVTTRVLQAGLSVQLFVQRCLMRLEKKVSADATKDSDWLQWKWMKNYRVWEANRKVFLYPENWLEPELRPNKSSFFKDLENELAQSDITKESAETAYGTYLEKLDNVARLDVCGMHYDEATYTYHVFGRTYNEPQMYYWRKWVEDRYWTPWEKIDMEIKSEYGVSPMMINNRLFLYWMEFVEKSNEIDNPATADIPNGGDDNVPLQAPEKMYEIHLTSIEFRNKKWQPKQVSKSFISTSSSSYANRGRYLCLGIDTTWMPDIPNGLQLNGRAFIGIFNSVVDNRVYLEAQGIFELGGCHGAPEILTDYEIINFLSSIDVPCFDRTQYSFLEDKESDDGNKIKSVGTDMLTFKRGSLAFDNYPLLLSTPGLFRGQFTMELSAIDKLIFLIKAIFPGAMERIPLTYGTLLPAFYEDKRRTFMLQPEIITWQEDQTGDWKKWKIDEFFYSDILIILKELIDNPGVIPDQLKKYTEPGAKYKSWPFYRFRNFYHPYVCFFNKQLVMKGIDGLMDRDVQLLDKTKFTELKEFSFEDTYQPWLTVNPLRYPQEDVDFEADGSYASYNWELFFHAPMYIAGRLSTNQRFSDAKDWYHYIFNPTDTSSHPKPQKYWNTKPFFLRTDPAYIDQRIDRILSQIHNNDVEMIRNVRDWQNNPFQPHLIAQFRTVAYQKAVLMKYIDNLIAWGDSLFRQDTREAIGEAAQYYVLAAELLGQKPRVVPQKNEAVVKTFNQVEAGLDAFSNALIDLENVVPAIPDTPSSTGPKPPLPAIEGFYFCLPPNEKLLGYWDTIADRLFKIRNCMNIDGETRSLALFSPPIDPALLVKAAAAGIDISAVLSDLNAPLPVYKFGTTFQKAREFVNEVKALGNALMQALEKKDAESLTLLRSTNEIKVLNASLSVRKMQVSEAKENLAALNQSVVSAKAKLTYYNTREFMNGLEKAAFAMTSVSMQLHTAGTFLDILGGVLAIIPDFDLGVSGFGGSPNATARIGGTNISKALELGAKAMYQTATIIDKGASLTSTLGSYTRRKDDWNFQASQARHEITQLSKQIAAATIRLAIAEKEMANAELNIDNSKQTDDFMRNKFSNEDLYEWMKSQISTVYFQAYKLALDMAKRAERCFRYEIGAQNTLFIQSAYWDNLHKGLLSGDKLAFDLNRMDAAYIEQNKREHEMTKHISLALLDPAALIRLREEGICELAIPEALFDLECPGHYFRRIKTISVSIPCIAGPYTSVNAKLTLLSSRVRKTSALTGGAYTIIDENDNRFEFNLGAIQSVVTSNAQNDSGLFETNLRDERYLPFEGQGAVSKWKIELLGKNLKGFDFESITDVVLNLKYTARYGGDNLRAKVESEINSSLNQLMKYAMSDQGFLYRAIPLRYEFPTEWHRFLNPPPASGDQSILLKMSKDLFPFLFREKNITVNDIDVYVKYKQGVVVANFGLDFVAEASAPGSGLSTSVQYGMNKYSKTGVNIVMPASGTINYKLVTWKGAHVHFNADEIQDIILVIRYSLS